LKILLPVFIQLRLTKSRSRIPTLYVTFEPTINSIVITSMKYKLLGRSGLKVSQLCLGTMGFGQATPWGIPQNESFEIMNAFGNAGGNFLDTANRYQDGQTEEIVGNFLSQSPDRDYWVVATKYSLYDNKTNPNASGNSRKNMMRSVENSLRRLKTDFIDVLYLHIWDGLAPMDEVLRGLDDLVRQGKITYIAISDTPPGWWQRAKPWPN
jgi:aryl-alcohol dehydrogenase-like predicted oxidoreductase